MKAEYLKTFFITWFVLLLVNQAFVFGCFAPHCLLAGLPLTGLVAFFITPFFVDKNTAPSSENNQTNKKSELEKVAETISSINKFTSEVGREIQEWGDETLKELEAESIMKKAERELRLKKEEEKVNAILDELKSKEYKQSSDPLKQRGDEYEKFIGKQFENKGELVIYNGFIRGYEDDGVDIIAISTQTKTIHLIQCKNWTKKPLLLEDVQNIYKKLHNFNLTRITQSVDAIREHLERDKSIESIKDILRVNKSDYSLRKTLYVGSDKVVDLNIGKHLKLITPAIFRYEDMKIVIKGIS